MRPWTRFSLVVTAFVLFLLMQAAFGMVVRELYASGRLAIGVLVAFLGFGVAGGFALGLAAMIPSRIQLRHARRAVAIAAVPALITAFNVYVAVAQEAAPAELQRFALEFTIGLQSVACVALGLAASSAVAES